MVEEGRNGFLVEPGDQNRLAEALLRLAKDKSLINRMGQRSLEIVKEKFDVLVIIERLISIYKQLDLKYV